MFGITQFLTRQNALRDDKESVTDYLSEVARIDNAMSKPMQAAHKALRSHLVVYTEPSIHNYNATAQCVADVINAFLQHQDSDNRSA